MVLNIDHFRAHRIVFVVFIFILKTGPKTGHDRTGYGYSVLSQDILCYVLSVLSCCVVVRCSVCVCVCVCVLEGADRL